MKFSVKIAGIFAVVAFALTAVSANAAFTRDLTLGSTGADVIELQTWLESKGFLTIPAGTSKGYFGGLTQAALAKYQASVGIVPAAGYFGPITKAKVAMDGGSDDSDNGSDDLSGGETSLEDEDLQAEDDAQEGEMKQVATFEFDVEDADASVDRLDLEFVFTGNASQADDEPWKAFDTITLMVDGEEIAEADVDDEDEWLRDDSPFVFRLTDIDYVVEEGETAEIEIYLTAADNVDGADTSDASWTIAVDNDGLRATDGDGIQNYVGIDTDTVAFEVEELGEGESLEIKSSSSDIDATTLLVDADEESEWHEVFVFELESEDSDIEVEDLVLKAKLDLTSTSTFNKVVSDMKVEIDGDEFDDYTVASGTATTTNITFDIDGDYTVDADDTVEVVVWVEFNQQDPNYNDGTTFQVETVSVSGEGLDNVSDTATVSGEAHTLSASTAEVTAVEWATSESANGETGIIDLFFTVTAEEDDFEVLGADIIDSLNGTASTTSGTATTTSGKAQVTRVSGDSVTSIAGGYRVNEGDTVKFRVRYEKRTPGSLEVTVTSVAGQELADDEQLSPTIILE